MTSIVVLPDVILDNKLVSALGVKGRTERRVTRAVTAGGFAQANLDWSASLRGYEMGTVPALPESWQRLEGLYEVVGYGAYAFLMQDPKDQTVRAGEGLLQPLAKGQPVGVAGNGFGVPTYRLVKQYTAHGTTRTHKRTIRWPLNPAIVRGVTPVSPARANDVVTFSADAGQAISSITVGATTVLNFANGTGMVAAMGVGERVYLTGIGGTAGAALNDLAHVVSAKGPTSLTITTVTTGLVATGGTAARYPQALEALTWTGLFYVPVHFSDDFIDWDLVRPGPAGTRLMVGPSIALQEVRE